MKPTRRAVTLHAAAASRSNEQDLPTAVAAGVPVAAAAGAKVTFAIGHGITVSIFEPDFASEVFVVEPFTCRKNQTVFETGRFRPLYL